MQTPARAPRTAGDEVRALLERLPELLRDAPLANGVVEMVVEGPSTPWRRLFDIHDGRIVPAKLGSVVPWASIAGEELAWQLALGAEADVSRLRHTGDPYLAERVLAAIAGATLCLREPEHSHGALGCS